MLPPIHESTEGGLHVPCTGTRPRRCRCAGKGNSYSANAPFLGVYWVVPASAFPNGQRMQSPLSAPYSLNGGGVQNVSGVALIPPGTKCEVRWNQVDVSLKRVFRVGRREIQGQMAVFNALNSNVVLAENEQFGASLGEPRNILQGRMLRLGLLFNF